MDPIGLLLLGLVVARFMWVAHQRTVRRRLMAEAIANMMASSLLERAFHDALFPQILYRSGEDHADTRSK